MRLVEDWKQAYKWFSVNITAIMVALNALQASVVQVQGFLSPTQLAVANALLGVLVIWGRLIQQNNA